METRVIRAHIVGRPILVVPRAPTPLRRPGRLESHGHPLGTSTIACPTKGFIPLDQEARRTMPGRMPSCAPIANRRFTACSETARSAGYQGTLGVPQVTNLPQGRRNCRHTLRDSTASTSPSPSPLLTTGAWQLLFRRAQSAGCARSALTVTAIAGPQDAGATAGDADILINAQTGRR